MEESENTMFGSMEKEENRGKNLNALLTVMLRRVFTYIFSIPNGCIFSYSNRVDFTNNYRGKERHRRQELMNIFP